MYEIICCIFEAVIDNSTLIDSQARAENESIILVVIPTAPTSIEPNCKCINISPTLSHKFTFENNNHY